MTLNSVKKYARVWLRIAGMSLSAQFSYGLGSAGFLLGKLVRLLFFFFYIVAIFRHTSRVAGYTLAETVLFFLTFNLVDLVTSIFFRGVYSARRIVEEGDLDYHLIQPCSPLFRMAASNVDFLDIATMLPVLILLAITLPKLPAGINGLRVALYLLLVLNGIGIALAIHIFVAAIAVRTQELENTIWIYRDMMFLGKFPVDIYAGPLRWVLTLVIPIGVMVSFPAKALLGMLGVPWTLYALALACVSLGASLWCWRAAISSYTSVSS